MINVHYCKNPEVNTYMFKLQMVKITNVTANPFHLVLMNHRLLKILFHTVYFDVLLGIFTYTTKGVKGYKCNCNSYFCFVHIYKCQQFYSI